MASIQGEENGANQTRKIKKINKRRKIRKNKIEIKE